MEDLYSKVKSKGAVLQPKTVYKYRRGIKSKRANHYKLHEPWIASELFNDQEFIPVRGQIIYFKHQEDIDYMLYQKIPGSNYFFHIYPWSDRLILGGVYEYGEEECMINLRKPSIELLKMRRNACQENHKN